MRPLHIGIDATALYGRYGGVEYSLWHLLHALSALEEPALRYTVYVPRDGPEPAVTRQFGARWRWRRLPFRGDEKLRRIAWQQFRLSRQLERDGCDLLHAATYVAPLSCRAPVVLTVYDLIALTHPQFATRANRLHYGWMMPRAIQRARAVIVPAAAVKTAIATRWPQVAPRVHVVPLAVTDEFRRDVTAAERARVREHYALPSEYLLFVGNPEPKKNLKTIRRALRLLPNAPPLVIAGGARPWSGYEPARDSRTRLLGYVPRQDLPALYAMCRAFLFPSLAEGFGLPVLEALGCGAPVVTSHAVALPGLQEVALLCDAEHPASIATQIRRVLDDEPLQLRLRAAGPAYARPFTWRRTAEATRETYKSVSANT